MMQPTSVNANTIQFNTPQQMVQHQQQQPAMDQSSYNARWPLKPMDSMDSATQSSFQEFTRYQMQYNLSQQQQEQPNEAEDSLADQLADLDEITRTDLESLLPGINDTDLDLGIDMKAPLESLLDAKDLELDLIDTNVANDTIVPTTSSQIPLNSGTGIPQSNVVNNQMTGISQQNNSSTTMLQYQVKLFLFLEIELQ